MKNSRKDKGFTIIEFLVIIAILGLLAGFLIPVISSARKHGKGYTGLHNVTIEWKEGIKKDEIDKTETIRSVKTIDEMTDRLILYLEDGSRKIVLLRDISSYEIEDEKRRKGR